MKRVLIADDEQDARQLLKEYLADCTMLQLIGEAADGPETLQKINSLKPDLVFLDIQMPGYNGFEVLAQLDYLPEIIFSTAYDQYALDAFKVHALDYLLKPYGKKRFHEAVKRIEQNEEKVAQLAEKLIQEKQNEKILVHAGKRRVILKLEEIYYLEAYGEYTLVHTKSDKFIITKGIAAVIESLGSYRFIRIHRSHAVHIDKVQFVAKEGRYYQVSLNTAIKLKVSETYVDAINSFKV